MTDKNLFAERLIKQYSKDSKILQENINKTFKSLNISIENQIKEKRILTLLDLQNLIISFQPILQNSLLSFYLTILPIYNNYDERVKVKGLQTAKTITTEIIESLSVLSKERAELINNNTASLYSYYIQNIVENFNIIRSVNDKNILIESIQKNPFFIKLLKDSESPIFTLKEVSSLAKAINKSEEEYLTEVERQEERLIAKKIQKESQKREEIISIMETGLIGEFLRLNSAKQKGYTKKTWIHTNLAKKPRDWHVRYSGTTIPINEKFVINGLSADAPRQFGSAKEDINCMCVAYYS